MSRDRKKIITREALPPDVDTIVGRLIHSKPRVLKLEIIRNTKGGRLHPEDSWTIIAHYPPDIYDDGTDDTGPRFMP